jgi:dTDP-4-dehydrorhamnose reductase
MSGMKVVVLGASGMLGSMVTDYLARDPELEVSATVRKPELIGRGRSLIPNVDWRIFDAEASDPSEGLSIVDGSTWVVNAVGVIKPFIHDDNPIEVERALRVNALMPYALARRTKGGARVLQIATDCVYSGSRGRYSEKDLHDPTDVYGKTKSLGEVSAENFIHLRCSIIGPEPREHRSLLGWFLSQGPSAQVSGYVNHRWNGITTLHFAKICRGIIKGKLSLPRLRHVVPAGEVTKCELLRLFAAHFDRPDIRIRPQEAGQVIDRTLVTEDEAANAEIWLAAGYAAPPSIPDMVAELAAFNYPLKNLASES